MIQPYFSWWPLYLASLAMVACLSLPATALTLVSDGQTKAVIVLPQEPADAETLAAQEIQQHIKQISGADLATVTAGGDLAGRLPIFIGAAADEGLLAAVRAEGDAPASFILQVDDASASLRGLSEQGTLFAAYELLEQLGVRWFMPGELGTVVPTQATLELKSQKTVQVPSFVARNMNATNNFPDWGKRMRAGGAWFPSSHGIAPFKGGAYKSYFETNPEYYALIDGVRTRRQLCVSNPQVLSLAIEGTKAYFRKYPDRPWIGVGPNDGGGFCECDNCHALDSGAWDAFSNERAVTDRYVWFFNKLLKGIESDYPDKKVGFYIYHTYMEPPVKVKADPRIVGALAPIALCRIHGPNNPICPEKSYYRKLVSGWSEAIGELYDRGYWFNLADPGLPFMMVHIVREQVPLAHEAGLTGWRVETIPRWANETPSLYIAAKLMWDHEADVDALLTDYHEKYYGPAAEPMAAYTELLDSTLRDGNQHTGGAAGLLTLYDSEMRARGRAMLDEAAKLAEGVYAKRVALTRQSFDYLEHFATMVETRTAGDFVASYEALQRLTAVQEQLLTEYDPPMLNPRAAKSYMKRFWGPTTEQGHARITGGNEPVAIMDDVWDFRADPQGLGEMLGWWGAGKVGGNWQPMHTASASWSDQGMRYYKGLAWYRQTVEVPKRFEGKRVFFWCGGADEKAKVWVNGEEIGIGPDAAFIPFELDATPAIIAGQTNTVTVLIRNERVDELGTGGITAPVMLYAPAAGDQAELENARNLGRTFP